MPRQRKMQGFRPFAHIDTNGGERIELLYDTVGDAIVARRSTGDVIIALAESKDAAEAFVYDDERMSDCVEELIHKER